MYVGYKQTKLVGDFTSREDTWYVFDLRGNTLTPQVSDNIREYIFNKVTPFVITLSSDYFKDSVLKKFTIYERDDVSDIVTLVGTGRDLKLRTHQVRYIDYLDVLRSTAVLVLDEDYNRETW